MGSVKALSMWQPWASLFVHGEKTIETRSWRVGKPTWDEYVIGAKSETPVENCCAIKPFRLAIHAAQRWTGALRRTCWLEPFSSALLRIYGAGDVWVGDRLPKGAILGTVEIYEFIPLSGSWHDLKELRFGDFAKGRWGWHARDFQPFKNPVPAIGRQGLFNIDLPENVA